MIMGVSPFTQVNSTFHCRITRKPFRPPRFDTPNLQPLSIEIMPDDRKNNRRLKWLSQTLDKKTFDIESDHAAMRMGNMFMEALGLNARFAFGHGMASRFDLNGDPNPLDANANAGHDANVNINRPLVNANIGDIANANNVKIEANNDELGPVKVEAPEVHDAPYYGPGDTDSSSDDSIVVDELAPFPDWSSSEDEKVRVPFPAENRKRARKGNVAPDQWRNWEHMLHMWHM